MSNKAKWDAVELEIAGIRKDFEAKLRKVEQERDAAVSALEDLHALVSRRGSCKGVPALLSCTADGITSMSESYAEARAEGFALAKEQALRDTKSLTECSCWNCSIECSKKREGVVWARDVIGWIKPDESLCVVPRETIEKVKEALKIAAHSLSWEVIDKPVRDALALLERVAKP